MTALWLLIISILVSRVKFSISWTSFSVCADKSYKNPLEDIIFNNDSFTIDGIERLVKENTWDKNEIFYFLDFPTVTHPGFPCMTTKDSVDPIRPCMFPLVGFDGELVHNCSHDGNPEPWCITKIDKQRKMFLDSSTKIWGLCRSLCSGKYWQGRTKTTSMTSIKKFKLISDPVRVLISLTWLSSSS